MHYDTLMSNYYNIVILHTAQSVLATLTLCVTGALGQPTPLDGAASDSVGFAGKLFESERFKDEARRLNAQNSVIPKSISDSLAEAARRSLPRLNDFGTALRFGQHNVVSSDGEGIIALIHQLLTSPVKARPALLARIQAFSQKGYPEAQTFVGFAIEHGLFGARQDLDQAIQFYRAAAAARYQPAIYNLALIEAYGKSGKPNLNEAAGLIQRAAMAGAENSFRVCGFGAFINYRRGDQQTALNYGVGCESPLTYLPLIVAPSDKTVAERTDMLRKSIATGLNDGFALLEQITHETAANDKQFFYCKYMLLNKYRHSRSDLRESAAKCYDQYAKKSGNAGVDGAQREMAIPGIAGFVPGEFDALQAMRKANHFHYAWSVPYLPFSQQDVDLYLPFFGKEGS